MATDMYTYTQLLKLTLCIYVQTGENNVPRIIFYSRNITKIISYNSKKNARSESLRLQNPFFIAQQMLPKSIFFKVYFIKPNPTL